MKNKKIVLIGGLVLVAVLAVIVAIGLKDKTSSENALFETVSTGSTDMGDVSVELTPKGVEGGLLSVELTANTHSVDLSQFNLKEIVTLRYEGKIINLSTAPELSGHHSSGILTFDVGNDIKKFTINIEGIPKVEQRIFQWGGGLG